MKITDKETAFLRKFMNNDIVSDNGWRSVQASTWTESLVDNRSEAAVLMVKGLMWNNGEAVGLTDAGREECEKLLAA